jgi:hypothetical protein
MMMEMTRARKRNPVLKMTEIRADVSLNGTDGGNLLQRLGKLRDEIETIEAHQKALGEMGYALELSSNNDGELLVEIKDKTTS